VITVPDLCGTATGREEIMTQWAQTDDLVIVACYPRAVRWLFDFAGYPLREGMYSVCNMREQTVEEICIELGISPAESTAVFQVPETDWPPWFPVIDRERCTGCKQCVSFCPFGVYKVVDEIVTVANPEKCKNMCPACARMCPATAILFPKCEDAPICGTELEQEPGTLDSTPAYEKVLEEGDLHDILARRKAFARARQGKVERPPAHSPC
jgi:NAD-dependent dihydropyrimidine dehydrogenase PreA subunit